MAVFKYVFVCMLVCVFFYEIMYLFWIQQHDRKSHTKTTMNQWRSFSIYNMHFIYSCHALYLHYTCMNTFLRLNMQLLCISFYSRYSIPVIYTALCTHNVIYRHCNHLSHPGEKEKHLLFAVYL